MPKPWRKSAANASGGGKPIPPRYWPLGFGRIITSPFGPRGNSFHAGTDFGFPGGSGGRPVYACASGTVIFAGAAQGYGGPDPAGWVVIDHPPEAGGGCTEYGHIIREVGVGDRVRAGQRIARINPSSATNGGTAPHLHLSVMPREYNPSAKVDPIPWLAGALEPEVLGLDYAAGRPGGRAIRDAGYKFVVRYLSDGGPSLPGKLLTPAEADDLRAHGIEIVSNWETTASWMLGGYQAGVRAAQRALAQVLRCGGRRDRPIYFSADWDATPQQQAAIDDCLRGCASIIGAENVGIYGGYWPVKRALDNGTARWAWQTAAWSGSNREPRMNMFQRIGYVIVGGVQCDVNEARTPDYGQWGYTGEDDMFDDDARRKLDRVYFELTNRWESRSPYRLPDGGPVDTAVGMLLNTDGMTHGDMIDRLATYGDPLAIERLILISSLTDPARAEDAARAKRALGKAPKAAVTKAAKAIEGK